MYKWSLLVEWHLTNTNPIPDFMSIVVSLTLWTAFRFLLHYVSRDDIELLAKGSNGAVEMRERIAKEPDDSPLYGFLRYRRRNILIKYLPEATSRVLKGTFLPFGQSRGLL